MQNTTEKYYTELMTKASKRIANLEAELAHTQSAATEPLAVIGMGCRFPGAENPAAFWQLLRNGMDMVREVPAERWDIDAYYDPDPDTPGKMVTRYGSFLENVDMFDAHFFGVSPREAVTLDPQQRILLEVTWEALEDAALSPTLLPRNTGVFIGISTNEYLQHLLKRGPEQIDAYLDTGNAFSTASGRLSYLLDLHGPCFSIETACSSSLVAVHQACQSLRRRECDAVLAGGVGIVLSPDYTINFSKARMMATDGRCKTFDAAANGYVRGDGCGLIVLKRLVDAVANGDRVLAVIRGSAINQDGRTSALTVPNGPAQQAVIRKALNDGGVEATQVSYIEAHGTGTALGDPIEMGALGEVFAARNEPLYVGSLKTNMGHLEAAAGIAGLIKTILALQHGEIPPHLHFQHPSPRIDWQQLPITIPTTLTPWRTETRIAGVSSFGFSGTNAHVIVSAWQPKQKPQASDSKLATRPVHLFTLSAKSETALQALAQRYLTMLDHPEDDIDGYTGDDASGNRPSLADLCYTANCGRTHFAHRLSTAVANHADLRQHLADWLTGHLLPNVAQNLVQGIAPEEEPRIAFLFTGQGAQYIGMGRELFETQPSFRQTLLRCDAILQPLLGTSILSILYPAPETPEPIKQADTERLDQTMYTQPALFALEYALAQLWLSFGFQPSVVLGHSVGEYVAACVAGVFSLEDGLKLIAARSRLMGALPTGGSMVAVAATAERVQSIIASVATQSIARQVVIAAYNAPESVVISGASVAIAPVVAALSQQGIECKALAVSHAFHSPLMEPMLADFAAVAKTITYAQPQIPIITNLTGKLSHDPKTITKNTGPGLTTAEICSASYWLRHIRQPVRFADSIATLQQLGIDICLEVGPKPTLLGLVRQCLDSARDTTKNLSGAPDKDYDQQKPLLLPSLRAGRADWETLLTSLGQLYVQGAEINWANLAQGELRQRIALPTYPFQRQRYWAALTPRGSDTATTPSITTEIVQMMDQGHLQQMYERLMQKAQFSVEERQLAPKLLNLLVEEHQAQRAQTQLAVSTARQKDTPWQDWLYTVSWQAQPLVARSLFESSLTRERPTEASTVPKTWLLFASREEPVMTLAAQLQAQGKRCVLVTAGQEYAIKKGLLTAEPDTTSNPLVDESVDEIVYATLNPLHREEYDRLFQDLVKLVGDCEGDCEGIIYLWGVNQPQNTPLTDTPATVLELCSGLLHLLQALNQTTWKPRLWLVTQNSQAVGHQSLDKAHTQIQIEQAPLWGIARTIMAEHPEVACRCFDFDTFTPPHWPTALLDELQGQDNEPQIAYRQGVRHVARLARQPKPETIDWVNQPSQVRLTEYGSPDNLHRIPFTRRHPAPNEVEIQVQAAGLNFRDVLNILGMLQSHYAAEYNIHHAADLPLGFECAGVVVATGTAIRHLAVGDRVIALAEGSFASFVTIDAHNVAQIPQGFSFEEAATIPLAFLTAYQGLHGLARLQAGERVLIHAAAGGVGQAAVQIAQAIGAEVYATAHPNKWEFLQSQQIEHLYNSRTADFAEAILQDTQGRGVDIVLNSLNGDLLAPSFQVLGQQGRFVEIGKLGIWSAEQVRAYRPDIAYYPFELGDGATDKTIPEMFAELMALFAEGKLKPLPHRVFPIEELGSAVRSMQQAKQRGKLVLSFAGTPQTACRADGSYLITGGLGGLGLQAAQSLAEAGAKHLILASRRTALPSTTQTILDQLQQKGVHVTVMQADVAVKADVQRLLATSQAIAPLRGIIHAAGVLDDGILLQQRVERLQKVMDSKVTGAWHLHQLSQSFALDFFVAFSSAASIMVTAGQGNYAAANTFLDALMQQRQANGLPSLSINWGAWAEVGMAADLSFQQQGVPSIKPAQGGEVLLKLLTHLNAHTNTHTNAQIVVQPTDWARYLSHVGSVQPFYAHFAQEIQAKQMGRQKPNQGMMRQQLESLSPEEQKAQLMNQLEETVRKVLGLPANQCVNPHTYLMEMGLDSLMAIEFRNHLMRSLNLSLPAQLVFDYPTLNLLHTYLLPKLFAPVPTSIVQEQASAANVRDESPIVRNVPHEDMLSRALIELCLSPVSYTLQLSPWTVRPAVMADVPMLSQLEREAYGWMGEDAIAPPQLFADRIELLNKGDIPWFWVMEHSGKIVAWQVLQPTSVDPYQYESWAEATDHGKLTATFDPHGRNVYLVAGGLRNNTTIVADHIMTLQTLLMLRAAGCRTAFCCLAMPGYTKYYTKTGKSPEAYLAVTDENGIPLDEFITYAISSWPIKPSFRLLRNGYPPDKDSGGHGVSTVFKLTDDFEAAIQETCDRIVRYADLLGLKNR